MNKPVLTEVKKKVLRNNIKTREFYFLTGCVLMWTCYYLLSFIKCEYILTFICKV